MNWERIEGNWKQFKSTVKQQWGKITDEQLDAISGQRHRLAGQIQETYAVSVENAEKQVATWQQAQKETTLEDDKPMDSNPAESK